MRNKNVVTTLVSPSIKQDSVTIFDIQESRLEPDPEASAPAPPTVSGSAPSTPLTPFNPATLTPDQRDGLGCVHCGNGKQHRVPVGWVDGCQVFACTPVCPGFADPPGNRNVTFDRLENEGRTPPDDAVSGRPDQHAQRNVTLDRGGRTPRTRLHANNAARQKAYRERLAAVSSSERVAPLAAVKQRRPPSRPARLAQLLKDVQSLAAQYEDWLAALPEQLQHSALADKLSETIEQLNGAADLLSDVDPPKGFGRD